MRGNHYRFSTFKSTGGDSPEWETDFYIPLANWQGPPAVSLKVWDQERNIKNYIGETDLDLRDLFENGKYLYADEANKSMWLKLSATRFDIMYDAGDIEVKFSLESMNKKEDVGKVWTAFVGALDDAEEARKAGEDVDGAPLIETEFNDFEDAPTEDEGAITDDSGEETAASSALEELTLAEGGPVPPSVAAEAVVAGKEGTTLTVPSAAAKARADSQPTKSRRRRSRKSKTDKLKFEFNVYSNTVGVAFMEIVKANDLPRMRNITRTGFDMDPFVVISFGKKTFRTPYKRHTCDPVYNEKLLFPVQRHEQNFSVNFAVLDHDKITLNDTVASADWSIQQLLQIKPEPNADGLFDIHADNEENDALVFKHFGDAHEYVIPLNLNNPTKYDNKPTITIRCQFLPYSALRQHFWRGLIRSYDIDDTTTISYVELTTMLDSLGSTLTEETKESFFTRFGKSTEDELTEDEVVMCLEKQIVRDSSRQWGDNGAGSGSGSSSPKESNGSGGDAATTTTTTTSGTETPLPQKEQDAEADVSAAASIAASQQNSGNVSGDESYDEGERVIQLTTCPICNQPRLRKRTEVDIVTHIATCACTNWAKMDALVLQRYVTASQASKRWYTKVASKLSYGNYGLGANSANILVQDRITGVVQEEKMNVYVRIGIRLLYKGLKSSRMEKKRIRGMLRSLSVKQGRKYDNPSSVQSIPAFIKFHRLNMDDVLEPVANFKNFNEFFYRKLKPGARKLEGGPKIAVSPADCRATFFPTIQKATEVWIKGRSFSVERLFGDAYPEYVSNYEQGSLAIFRLAPQDYHRFHIPVSGTLGEPRKIEGEYYTVNPMAIRSALDVYGENVRVLVPIDSPEFGKVMVVCVGAMMVGSTVITAKPGSNVERMDELGYFQFGGSTLVVLFEPGRIAFDEDLVANSAEAVETLVRVGMSIGHVVGEPEFDRQKHEISQDDVERAKREILGGGGPTGLPDFTF